MLVLLSPAKSLDFEPLVGELAELPHTLPSFPKQTVRLIAVLKTYSPQQIAALMGLSDALSSLNVARYQAWRPRYTAKNAKQAILAFNGDVYAGFEASSLSTDDLTWAQAHVCMLSGLYGVLRPLDWMQPYRLEMGTQLPVGTDAIKTKNLYGFWGSQIASYLNQRLKSDPSPVVINLASQEYFKVVRRSVLAARVVDCVFEDWHIGTGSGGQTGGGQFKVISFYAKRARGLMARFAIQQRARSLKALQAFAAEGYAYEPAQSSADRLLFRRRAAA